jgi:hypothetical protein
LIRQILSLAEILQVNYLQGHPLDRMFLESPVLPTFSRLDIQKGSLAFSSGLPLSRRTRSDIRGHRS